MQTTLLSTCEGAKQLNANKINDHLIHLFIYLNMEQDIGSGKTWRNSPLVLIPVFVLSLLIVLIVPVVLLALSPFLLFRALLRFVVIRKRALSPRSTIMSLGNESEKPKNALVLPFVLKGVLDLENFRAKVQTKLLEAKDSRGRLKYPELKQNLVSHFGFLFFQDIPDFKLEDHVYILPNVQIGANDGGSLSTTNNLVKQLLEKRWRKDRALWEIILVPYIKTWSPERSISTSTFLILLRFHHGLVDGFSVLKFIAAIDSSGGIRRLLNSRTGAVKSSSSLKFLKIPWDLAYSAITSPPLHPDPFNLKNRTLAGVSSRGASSLVPLALFKSVRTSLGLSFTAVYTSMIALGVKRYFKIAGRGHKNVLFRLPIPLPGQKDKLQNKMSFATVILELGNEDRGQLGSEIQKQFEQLKKSTLPLSLSLLSQLGGSLPGPLLNPMVEGTLGSQHVFVSNFPGPLEPWNVCGCDTLDGYFSSAVAGTAGIVFTATTNQDTLSISVGADMAILPSDQEGRNLLDFCVQELDALNKIFVLQTV